MVNRSEFRHRGNRTKRLVRPQSNNRGWRSCDRLVRGSTETFVALERSADRCLKPVQERIAWVNGQVPITPLLLCLADFFG